MCMREANSQNRFSRDTSYLCFCSLFLFSLTRLIICSLYLLLRKQKQKIAFKSYNLKKSQSLPFYAHYDTVLIRKFTFIRSFLLLLISINNIFPYVTHRDTDSHTFEMSCIASKFN